MSPVVHVDSLEAAEVERGRTRFTRRRLSQAAGGKDLGASHMTLPPGARSWPFHWHGANEEAIYVLEGEATLRLGDAEHRVRAGDYVALPVGPAHAHQLVNDSDAPLVYLCLSTMRPCDIGVYPDSDKVGLFAGAAPGGDIEQRFLHRIARATDVDYWDGETSDD